MRSSDTIHPLMRKDGKNTYGLLERRLRQINRYYRRTALSVVPTCH